MNVARVHAFCVKLNISEDAENPKKSRRLITLMIMGASPKETISKRKVTKWRLQIDYLENGHRRGGTVTADAPTEEAALRALYARCKNSSPKFEIVKITNSYRVEVDE